MAIVSGSYTGNGATNRTIALAFTPKFVVVQSETVTEAMHLSNVNTGTRRFALSDNAYAAGSTTNDFGPGLTTNGFIVSGNTAATSNRNGYVFHYYAIG
jgi:hypothetical protein